MTGRRLVRLVPAQEIALLALPALPAGPTCTKPKTVSVNKNCKRKAWNLHQTQVECLFYRAF